MFFWCCLIVVAYQGFVLVAASINDIHIIKRRSRHSACHLFIVSPCCRSWTIVIVGNLVTNCAEAVHKAGESVGLGVPDNKGVSGGDEALHLQQC